MKALLLARLLLPVCAVLLVVVAVIAAAPIIPLILWGMVAAVPVVAGLGWWYRQWLVRDEAAPPFGDGPEPPAGATRSLDRPVVAGQVVTRSDAPVRGSIGS